MTRSDEPEERGGPAPADAGRKAPEGEAQEREAQEAEKEREIPLATLLQGARRVIIRHGERRYLLQVTRQNRLILTKYDGHS